MRVVVAQLAGTGIEPLIGGGAFGALALLTIHIIRRTHQIDTRNDTVSKAYIEIAFQREAAMSARLDAALAQIEQLHAEMALIRKEHDLERARWETKRE